VVEQVLTEGAFEFISQKIAKEGWTVEIPWRDFTRTRGPLDLAKVHGDYSASIRSSKLRRK
jgi:hypothetical protein